MAEVPRQVTKANLALVCRAVVTQVMWLLSGKVSEDIFRKQLERIVGAVATHLQQQQGERTLNVHDSS